MTRLFGRGELKVALLLVADELGPANGYALMQGLADRVGSSWTPSPGAVYPALLSLEDAGLLIGADHEGGRRYTLSDAGAAAVAAAPDVLDEVAGRARRAPHPPVTVGSVLDELAADAPFRSRPLGPSQVARVRSLFQPLLAELRDLTAEEAP